MGGRLLGRAASGPARKHWWQEESEEARAVAAWGAYDALKAMQSYREEDHLRFACLYGAREMAGLLSAHYSRPAEELKSRLPYNIISEAIDTRQSKICQGRPRTIHAVSGGSWKKKRKAKLLNKFVQGVFHENKVYQKRNQTFLDAEIIGDGVFQVSEVDGRVHIERVLASELYVDEAEAKYGCPRQMYRARSIAREVLLAHPDYQKPEQQAAILAAPASEGMDTEDFQGDMIDVLEAWHLPSGPPKKDEKGDEKPHDGTYLRAVRGQGTLKGSELSLGPIDCFPFVFDKCRAPLLGFWGQPTVARLVGYQVAVNRLCKRIDGALKNAVVSFWVPEMAGVDINAINNGTGSVYKYKGGPNNLPTAIPASFVPGDYFRQLDNLRAGAMREVGVSDYDVSMVKPAGLNSGAALREHNFKSDARLVVRAQEHEQFLAVDLAQAVVDLAHSIARRPKEGGAEGEVQGYRVRVPNSSHVEELDFLDVGLEREEYSLQVWPGSSLAVTPEGKRDEMVEFMQLGLISGADFLRETQTPDTEGFVNLVVSAIDHAQWKVDQILEEGKMVMPEPFDDLEQCKRFALAALFRGVREKYPQKRLDNLRSFIDACQRMLNDVAAASAPPPQPALPAPPPPGMEPPPQLPGPMQQAA